MINHQTASVRSLLYIERILTNILTCGFSTIETFHERVLIKLHYFHKPCRMAHKSCMLQHLFSIPVSLWNNLCGLKRVEQFNRSLRSKLASSLRELLSTCSGARDIYILIMHTNVLRIFNLNVDYMYMSRPTCYFTYIVMTCNTFSMLIICHNLCK